MNRDNFNNLCNGAANRCLSLFYNNEVSQINFSWITEDVHNCKVTRENSLIIEDEQCGTLLEMKGVLRVTELFASDIDDSCEREFIIEFENNMKLSVKILW